MAQKYVKRHTRLQSKWPKDECSSDDDCQQDEESFDTIESTQMEVNANSSEDAEESLITGLNAFRERNQNRTKHCAKCSEKIRVTDPGDFMEGQHIATPGDHLNSGEKLFGKRKHVYKHHFIVRRITRMSSTKVQLDVIHFTKEGKNITICESKKIFDSNRDEMYIVRYKYPRYSPQEIVERAESMLPANRNENGTFKSYNLFTRNCEHFATWCVVGEKESGQVQSARDRSSFLPKYLADCISIGKLISRIISNTADEIARAVSKVSLPFITLVITTGIYLLYCIGMTLYHIYKYKKGSMCWSCFKEAMLSLWLEFGLFATFGAACFAIMTFALPLLGPWVVVPSVIIFTLVGIYLQWNVRKVVHAMLYPLSFDKYTVESISEINVGDIISMRYYGLQHDMIVTNVSEDDSNNSRGTVRCVHYGLPERFLSPLFGTREIMEENFPLDLTKKTVKRYAIDESPHLPVFSPQETARRAKQRVGETKWSVKNRSDHMCMWAKFKDLPPGVNCSAELPTYNTDDSSESKKKINNFIKKKEVFVKEEISVGDVVVHKRTTGIVVSLQTTGSSSFELAFVTTKGNTVIHVKRQIELKKERVFVNRYLPAQCHPMETRAKNAAEKVGSTFRREKFIKHCIMLES